MAVPISIMGVIVIDKYLKLKVITPAVIGILIGGMLFTFGAYEDAPGMCAIGLSIGFILVMVGLNHSGIIKKGWLTPILFLSFSIFIMVLTTSILFEGEFESKPWLSAIGYGIAAILSIIGVMKIKKLQKRVNAIDE